MPHADAQGWLTEPALAFLQVAAAGGLLPASFPVTVDGEPTIATVPVKVTGRVLEAVAHPDQTVRVRAMIGLMTVARERVQVQLGAGGVIPA